MSGQSITRYLEERDPFERAMMELIAKRYFEIQHQMDRSRAILIAKALSGEKI